MKRAILLSLLTVTTTAQCLGEYVQCPNGACVLDVSLDCKKCDHGYLCPTITGVDAKCIDQISDYSSCPGLQNTHLDPTLDEQSRLAYLVQHTSTEEQIQQLQNGAPGIHEQGIPAYQWLNDDQHGVARTPANATVFPNGVGLGATFDAPLLHQVGFVVGNEARGLHRGFLDTDPTRAMKCNGCGMTAYAPNLNLVRDPRWGRAQEVYTEDPILMSELVTNFVTGLQNNTEGVPVGPDGKHVQAGACCKHFAVYDIEGGAGTLDRYHFDAEINGRNFWESYVVGFDACVNRGKAMHVMCSYNSVNGVPTCANEGLLTEILRNQWKYEGFVVSDYDAWANIFNTHKYSKDMVGAAADGINAGMDQEGGGTAAIDQLSAAISSNQTTADAVSTSFRRLMLARIRLGMFDPPTDVSYNSIVYNQTELAFNEMHNKINQRAAEESMTLLKNDKESLPLSLSTIDETDGNNGIHTLGLMGFQSNNAGILSGNYAGSANINNWGMTITDTLTKMMTEGGGVLKQADGCSTVRCPEASDPHGFDEAKEVAKESDAVVILLGLAFDQYCLGFPNGNNDFCEAEGKDRDSIELPSSQKDLVLAARASLGPSKIMIAVMIHGGAVALDDETLDALDAVVDAFYPGPHGAQAIADCLFGVFSPSGRLPVTFYRQTTDLPALDNMDWYPQENVSQGISYRYFQGQVLYPFGHGLSYAEFKYTNFTTINPSLSSSSSSSDPNMSIGPCDVVKMNIDVTNVGSVDSDEVVQCYVKQPHASVPVPQVRLAAFARVHVLKGQTVTVSIEIPPSSHTIVQNKGGDATGNDIYQAGTSVVVEKGTFIVYCGGGQPDYDHGVLSVDVDVVSSSTMDYCKAK